MAEGAPPPWLFNMQRCGPPPPYPRLKIPGLNVPILPGASFGYILEVEASLLSMNSLGGALIFATWVAFKSQKIKEKEMKHEVNLMCAPVCFNKSQDQESVQERRGGQSENPGRNKFIVQFIVVQI